MVKASELLGIGASGGGSAQIESTVATGSSIAAGQAVSVNAAGEFVPFDGSLPLFGVASAAAGSGATTTITSVAQFAGTVVTFANASELNGEVKDIDLTTAALDSGNTFALTGVIKWNGDGTGFTRLASNTLTDYSLSVAYDLTTAVAGASLSLAGDDSQMNEFCFGKGGNKLYTIGLANDDIYEYNLSSPYAGATASLVTSLSIPALTYQGIDISADGKYILVVEDGSDTARMYTLGTAFSVATGALTSTSPVIANQIRDCLIGSTGDKIFILDDSGNAIEEYSLSTDYNLTTLNTTPANSFVVDNFATSMSVSSDFVNVVVASSNLKNYTNTPITTPVTIDSGVYVYSDSSGKLTSNNTGNFVGFKVTPTQLIFTEEPA